MTIFDYADNEALGKIISVDTAMVVVRVDELERLKRVQVNRLVALQSSKPGQHLVGVVSRITRKAPDQGPETDVDESIENIELPENNLAPIIHDGHRIRARREVAAGFDGGFSRRIFWSRVGG